MLRCLALLLLSVPVLACGGLLGDALAPKPAPEPADLTCAADADCLACGTESCGCTTGKGACEPTRTGCYADPCRESQPACRDGRCVLERKPPPTACTTDADCEPCWLEGCGCMAATECPPVAHGCVADPCDGSTAVCREGTCALERTAGQ